VSTESYPLLRVEKGYIAVRGVKGRMKGRQLPNGSVARQCCPRKGMMRLRRLMKTALAMDGMAGDLFDA
jgi:hypothetical protein